MVGTGVERWNRATRQKNLTILVAVTNLGTSVFDATYVCRLRMCVYVHFPSLWENRINSTLRNHFTFCSLLYGTSPSRGSAPNHFNRTNCAPPPRVIFDANFPTNFLSLCLLPAGVSLYIFAGTQAYNQAGWIGLIFRALIENALVWQSKLYSCTVSIRFGRTVPYGMVCTTREILVEWIILRCSKCVRTTCWEEKKNLESCCGTEHLVPQPVACELILKKENAVMLRCLPVRALYCSRKDGVRQLSLGKRKGFWRTMGVLGQILATLLLNKRNEK